MEPDITVFCFLLIPGTMGSGQHGDVPTAGIFMHTDPVNSRAFCFDGGIPFKRQRAAPGLFAQLIDVRARRIQ
ncbi:MAG: hypothetical protein ACJ8G3_03065 [Burkholderiaceae bacterium]